MNFKSRKGELGACHSRLFPAWGYTHSRDGQVLPQGISNREENSALNINQVAAFEVRLLLPDHAKTFKQKLLSPETWGQR